MKKKAGNTIIRLLVAVALLLFLFSVVSVHAELATPVLSQLYHAGKHLLTEADNMTVSGKADFMLEGFPFKHAEGVYAQQEYDSYQQISLRSPRKDGSILENGYAVIDMGGTGYHVERYPGHVLTGKNINAPKNHALRSSVSSEALLSLGQQVASVMDLQMADKMSFTHDSAGTKVSFQWEEEDIPVLFNGTLNLFWQEAARRYFSVLYDDMPLEGYALVEDYPTVTQGILFCTRNLTLKYLQTDATMDSDGRLLNLEGSAAFQLDCRGNESLALDVSFSLTVENYGTTRVQELIPLENQYDQLSINPLSPDQVSVYFDMLASTGDLWESFGLPSLPVPESRLSHRPVSSLEEAVAYAREIASMDFLGLTDPDLLTWSASLSEENRYDLQGILPDNPDQIVFFISFDREGTVHRLENCSVSLKEASILNSDDLDADPVVRWRGEASLLLWFFEENLNPGITGLSAEQLRTQRLYGIGYAGYDSTLSIGEETFVVTYATLNQDPLQKVKYILQVAPQVRLVLRDGDIDYLEGGNG